MGMEMAFFHLVSQFECIYHTNAYIKEMINITFSGERNKRNENVDKKVYANFHTETPSQRIFSFIFSFFYLHSMRKKNSRVNKK